MKEAVVVASFASLSRTPGCSMLEAAGAAEDSAAVWTYQFVTGQLLV